MLFATEPDEDGNKSKISGKRLKIALNISLTDKFGNNPYILAKERENQNMISDEIMLLLQPQPDEHYSVTKLTIDTLANTQIIGDNAKISDFNL